MGGACSSCTKRAVLVAAVVAVAEASAVSGAVVACILLKKWFSWLNIWSSVDCTCSVR